MLEAWCWSADSNWRRERAWHFSLLLWIPRQTFWEPVCGLGLWGTGTSCSPPESGKGELLSSLQGRIAKPCSFPPLWWILLYANIWILKTSCLICTQTLHCELHAMLVGVWWGSRHSLYAIEKESPVDPLKEATWTDRFGKDKGPRGSAVVIRTEMYILSKSIST